MNYERLTHAELLQLARWNTPTIYNGWEQITELDAAHDGFNREETHDFMPQMGTMAGYAVTVVIEPGNPEHPKKKPGAWSRYREYVASAPSPKIVVVQDLDKPHVYGAFWGEVNSNVHKALGCCGTIIDGGIRDLDEMMSVGFKALARRLCVGHAHAWPVQWDCEVSVFGTNVQPGQLVVADKHGFLVIPHEDERNLLDATNLMDENECRTMIAAARASQGKKKSEMLEEFDAASKVFDLRVQEKFGERGEW